LITLVPKGERKMLSPYIFMGKKTSKEDKTGGKSEVFLTLLPLAPGI